MSEVLDYILRTNLFNFIIFAGIIAFLYIKLDVAGNLDKAKDTVKEDVSKSEDAKQISEENLSTVEKKMANLDSEIEEIIAKSVGNAKIVGSQIIDDANKKAESIHENSVKLIDNKALLLKNDIIKRASLASVEVAKAQIITELNNNYELHEKLINESVDALEKIEAGGEG